MAGSCHVMGMKQQPRFVVYQNPEVPGWACRAGASFEEFQQFFGPLRVMKGAVIVGDPACSRGW